MDDSSAFFNGITKPAPDSGFELLHSSENGPCGIWRADREGKFRVFKALKPQMRGLQVYESMLRKEFEIAYTLSHPNICEVYAFHSLPELGNCIEMEWVDGEPMDKAAVKDPDKVAAELCSAVAYLHSRQIVHRDIKPSNILITHNGESVKLIDFGLSDSDAHSRLKDPAGSRYYAAPEVLHGAKGDASSDIYSLGVVLSELSDARRFQKVARKCMAADPQKRYSSAEQVRRSLAGRISGWFWLLAAICIIAAGALLLYYSESSRSVDDIFLEATEMVREVSGN